MSDRGRRNQPEDTTVPSRARRYGRDRRGVSYEDFMSWLNNLRRRHGLSTFVYDGEVDKPINVDTGDSDAEPEVVEELKKLIEVKSADLNVLQNGEAHNTSEYEFSDNVQHLVVRRGQDFTIEVEFNRPYSKEKDDLRIVFETGKYPIQSKGTRVSLILSDEDKKDQWGAKIVKQDENKVTIKVFTPPICIVANWVLKLEAINSSSETPVVKTYKCPKRIYILFNPWCEKDQVYHRKKELLEEYVLSDKGKIFVGTAYRNYGRPWVFGQFEKDVLDCVMKLLDSSSFPVQSRGNPVLVTRKLSALVNTQDDRGILVGNWSGDYGDYASPTSWTGSTGIIGEYYTTNKSVRYGQCWVFSGVLTTCLRALGIPARSVTNFASAHDTDESMTIDSYFNADGDELEHMKGDSIWNFHVWNDAWMARPDLDGEYGGWQACDATPQETSDGMFQCGPSPLVAIKRGEVTQQYDTKFIFAEVNADKVNWIVNEKTGELKVADIKHHGVGKRISTKLPGSGKRQDINDEYKFSEGSAEERASILKANKASSKPFAYDHPEEGEKDVDFKLVEKDDVMYGQNVFVQLDMKNTSSQERHIKGSLSLKTCYTTGVHAQKVLSQKVDLVLKPGDSETLKMEVSFDDYDQYTVEECYFKVLTMLQVKETNQIFCEDDAFRLLKPDLEIKAPEEIKVGQKTTFEVSFKNPLPVVLTNCKLFVEMPGVQKSRSVDGIQKSVKPMETFVATFDVVPAKEKKSATVVAVFSSKQLVNISGDFDFKVTK